MLLTACSREPVNHHFNLENAQLAPTRNGVNVRLEIDARISHAATEALSRGVTLSFLVNSEIRQHDSRNLVAVSRDHWTLRYLALSDQYQLNGPGPQDTRTFPRLRHVEREMGSLEYPVAAESLDAGDYTFRVRARLDRSALPAPMQLPAMLFPYLRHDTGWSEWPLKIND